MFEWNEHFSDLLHLWLGQACVIEEAHLYFFIFNVSYRTCTEAFYWVIGMVMSCWIDRNASPPSFFVSALLQKNVKVEMRERTVKE